MFISEITGDTYLPAGSELQNAIKDLIARSIAGDVKDLDSREFLQNLRAQGHKIGMEQMLKAIDASGYASSQDKEKIVPKDELSGDVDTEVDDTVDVGNMAGGQAMKDVKAEL